ncbi:MAG: 6-pyruvoyl trahydropterin synthase family protein [Candidatus Kapaibacterium sp.]
MIYVTRKAHFSAAHRLYNPTFSDERNDATFDKCNNPMGHGHNYTIECTVAGNPDPLTGYVIDLKKLAALMDELIIEKVDHKHLNFDVPELRGIIPTAENIALVFWQMLEPKINDGKLFSIKVFESDNNFVEYKGEPVGEIPRYEKEMVSLRGVA